MKNLKKTIFITTSPQKTSVTNFFYELAKTFLNKGYTVVMIFDKNQVRDDNTIGLIYKSWPSYRPTSIKDLFFLKDLIREYKPSYIISNFGAVNISLIGGFLFGIKNRVAWIHTKSNQIKRDTDKNRLKAYILQLRKSLVLNFLSTEIYTNSKSTKENIKQFYFTGNKPIKVVYFLLEKIAVKNKKNTEQKIVSFIARFSPSKGQEILIKAIPKIIKSFPNCKFFFIGEGKTRQAQEELARSLNVYNNCVFTGSIPQLQVYEYLSKSTLHVSASDDEAFGMVNLEALAYGTPILAHNVGGISEILEDNVNGFFFTKFDSDDLSTKIIAILKDKELFDRLKNGAINSFEKKFLLNEENLNNRLEVILSKNKR